MKQIIFPLILSLLPLTACNSSNNPENKTQNTASSSAIELTQASKKIIDEYNQILIQAQDDPDRTKTNQKLKEILPKINEINSDKERNSISLNINMTLGNYDEAYSITNKILAKKETANMKNFQCLLTAILNKPKTEIENCYLYNAEMYKKQLANLPKTDHYYDQTEWAYYASLYHAGKAEYKSKLKKLVDSKSSPEEKETYETLYEIETTPDGRKSMLDKYKSPI